MGLSEARTTASAVEVRGLRLHVEDTGEPAGGAGVPIVWSHGLLWSTRLWDRQIAAFRDRYRCVAWDHRGQGRSDVPAGDEASIEDCYEDAVALIEELALGPVHFVGLSMGGFVGMRLAARRPDLVRKVVSVESAGDPEPVQNHRKYKTLNTIARLGGLRLCVPSVMPIFFGDTFLSDPAREADRQWCREQLLANRRTVFKAVNGVIRRKGMEDELGRIRTPVLAIHGREDRAIVAPRVEKTVAAIPGAEIVWIDGAGHSSAVEQPEAVNRAIAAFLG